MYRLLLLAIALPLVGTAAVGHAAHADYHIDIVAIDLAGHWTNLTPNPADDLAPAVARDGRIAFVSTRDGRPELYVMNGDGRNVRRLTTSAGVAWAEDLEASRASWSPRGDRIAFDGKYWAQPPACLRLCTNWKVQVIGSDGDGLGQIAVTARAPAWSPDGRRLAYESGVDAFGGATGITIARVDGSGSVRVNAHNADGYVAPVWSPGGGEVAFQANGSGGSSSGIYVVRADGSHKRRLATGHDPAWSPDGRSLAYIRDFRLLTIDRSGKSERRLSRKGEFVVSSAWSPRGRTLAFVAGTSLTPGGAAPRNLRVGTVGADGKHERVLVHEPGSATVFSGPVWAPDGKRILVAVG